MCDEVEVLEVETIREAIIYGEKKLSDYANNYEYLATVVYDESELEEYYRSCAFYIEGITKEEFLEYKNF